jgi:hypothetical protein
MEMKSFVRDSLRRAMENEDVELFEIKKGSAKNVESWWENLPGKLKRKVCDILGLDKGRDLSGFDTFDSSEQDEISAYWKKHKGVIEGFGESSEEKFSDSRAWINVEKSAKNYNAAKKMLEKSLALCAFDKKFEGGNKEAVDQVWSQLRSGKEIDLGYEI